MTSKDANEHNKTALIVAYAAGTATEAERAEVERMIATDDDAAARLALARSSRTALAQNCEGEQDAWSPGEMGFRRLMREIDREQERRSLQWTESLALWRGVAAAALIALAVVGLWRGGGGGSGGSGDYELAAERSDARVIAQITFAPSTTEAEIRALLIGVDARLIDGPSALGVYRLAFENALARKDGLALLKKARAVESANAE